MRLHKKQYVFLLSSSFLVLKTSDCFLFFFLLFLLKNNLMFAFAHEKRNINTLKIINLNTEDF